MRKNSGFTVIELVVVIAIVAIVTAFTIPSVMSWIPEKRLRSAGDELFSNLLYAKMQAIKNNVSWAVVFNPPPSTLNTYEIHSDYYGADTTVKTVNLTDYGDGVRYGGGNATAPISPDVSIPVDGVSYSGPSNVAVFNSRGMSVNTGFVYLRNNAGSAVAAGTPAMAGVVAQRYWSSGWQ
jgi:prepilin-type N-terminal cleavage/methylation domain-containing protein